MLRLIGKLLANSAQSSANPARNLIPNSLLTNTAAYYDTELIRAAYIFFLIGT